MQFTLEELYTKKEGQTYDRKSARKDPKGLSNHIVAFANADGGTLVIGIEDDFTVTGIDRMFNEMATAGLPAPEYRDNAFMLNATIRNGVINEVDGAINEVINGAINISATEQAVLSAIKKNQKIIKVELQKETSFGKSTIDRSIKALKEKCLIERIGSNKTGYWKIINK